MNVLCRLLFKARCLRLTQRISTMQRLRFRRTKRIHRIHMSSAMGRIIHCSLYYEDALTTRLVFCRVVEHNMVNPRKPLLLRQYQQARRHALARRVPRLAMLGVQALHASPYLHVESAVSITKSSC